MVVFKFDAWILQVHRIDVHLTSADVPLVLPTERWVMLKNDTKIVLTELDLALFGEAKARANVWIELLRWGHYSKLVHRIASKASSHVLWPQLFL